MQMYNGQIDRLEHLRMVRLLSFLTAFANLLGENRPTKPNTHRSREISAGIYLAMPLAILGRNGDLSGGGMGNPGQLEHDCLVP